MITAISLALILQFPLGGYLRFETYVRADSVRTVHKLASTLQISTSLERRNLLGKGIFNFIFDRMAKERFTVRPLEAYLRFSRRDFDFTLGKKILTWGTGVYISPSDIVNPWDFSYLYSDLEEFREGIESFLLDYYRGNSFIELGFIPCMRPNRYPIPETFSTLEMAPCETTVVHMDPNQSQLPEKRLENGEYYVRGMTSIGPIDLMAFYFKGYDRDPDLSIKYVWRSGNQTPFPDTMNILLKYNPIWATGGNFSWIISPYEIHGDFAYLGTKDKNGADPIIKNPYFFGALGFGRTFLEDRLSLSLDYLLKKISHFNEEANPEEKFISEEARKLNFQYGKEMHFVAFHLSYTNRTDIWRFQSMGIYDITAKEHFFINSINYSWADGVNIRLGAILSGKKGESPFTQMGKHFGQVVFVEGRYSF